jgi:hypothetical protein
MIYAARSCSLINPLRIGLRAYPPLLGKIDDGDRRAWR